MRIGRQTLATGLLGLVLAAVLGVAVLAGVQLAHAGAGNSASPQVAVKPADQRGAVHQAQPVQDLPVQPVGGPETRIIPATDLALLLGRATAEERKALDDGVVTRNEFLGAFSAAQACTEEAAAVTGNVVVDSPVLDGDHPRFGMMHSPDKDAIDQVGQAHLDCVERHFNEVLAAWGIGGATDGHQAILEATATCLRQLGYRVPDGANRRQLAEAVGQPGDDISDFYECEASATGQPMTEETD